MIKLLSIDETTSLLKKRDPRNHLEHFDERLEEWYATSTHHNIIDVSIGPPNIVSGPIDFMRYFNTTTFAFRFRGDEYEITPIFNEIKSLLQKVDNELDKPSTI